MGLIGAEFDNDETSASNKVGFQAYKNKQSNINQTQFSNTFFHSNPIDFCRRDFRNEENVFVKEIKIDLNTIIESYTKCIRIFFKFIFLKLLIKIQLRTSDGK